MATLRTLDEAHNYIEETITDWVASNEEKKVILLAARAEKMKSGIGGPAAQIKALKKNINSSVLKLKRNIFSSPKAKTNLEEELKWSKEELARLESTYVPKTRKPTEK